MKKLFIYLGIILGVAAFAVMALVVVMMLAPGTEIFGIKYISAVVGKHEETVALGHLYNKNIYLHVGDVPVNVSFGQPGTIGVEYVQHYQGFTRSTDVPEIKLTKADGSPYVDSVDTGEGTVHIYVNQYKKFVWSNGMKEFYLNFNLPAGYSSQSSLHIISENSDITFTELGSQTLNTLTVETSQSVEFKTNILNISTLNLKAGQAVELGSNMTVKNIVAEITNESLTVKNAVFGNVSFKTGGGNLNLKSCSGNVVMTSGSGGVTVASGGVVGGDFIVETNSGSISVPALNGDVNTIKTVSGHINITTCNSDLSIEANRSTITLGTVNGDLAVTTTTGSVNVTKVVGDADIKSTRNGDVSCGQIGGSAVIETNTGDASISSALTGDLTFKSETGNISFVSCNNLIVNSTNGSVLPYSSTSPIVVNGLANITTQKGQVLIGQILGDGKSTIKADNGAVTITTISGELDLDSYNSTIVIDFVDTADIDSSYSQTTVKAAPNGLDISNISGDISVGEAGDIGNLKAVSTEGKITAKNTVGTVELFSRQKITLENKNSTNIKINTSGDYSYYGGAGEVTATGLKGTIKVYSANGRVHLTLAELSGDIRVDTNNSSQSVTIDASCVDINKVNYHLQSQRGTDCYLFYGDVQQNPGQNIYKQEGLPYNTITAITTSASVTLILNSSNV